MWVWVCQVDSRHVDVEADVAQLLTSVYAVVCVCGFRWV